jgi:hypothetical protein
MSIVSNIFCPECDSVLDISKTVIKKVFDIDDTPSSMSEEEPKDKTKKEAEIENTTDASSQLYYICKSCHWTQKIKPGTQIMSKINSSGEITYLNLNKHKNKINSSILPYTRNYLCPNDKCIGNKEKDKHEAVMFRANGTMKTMYVCCGCQTVFSGH